MVGLLSDKDADDAGHHSDEGAGDAAAQVLDSLPQITGLVTLTDLLLSFKPADLNPADGGDAVPV